mmetsp:Transcript_68377/g.160301  ORF Transcript_68377/g.160301 Transcript_68377/m.160301 type:complete len:1015 (-) Transcript_68377:327-3371(-)
MFSSGPLEARLLQLEAAISEIKQVNADVVKRVDQLEFDSRRPHPGVQGDLNGDIEASETSSSESDLVHRHYDTKGTGITDHPVESAEGYVFEENCWDVVVCFGHPAIGYGSSLLLLFLLGLTIFLQLVFCYMVATSFTENPYDTSSQNALSYWRIDMAHKASQVSSNSMTSLASRACGFDKALATSFSEKEIAQNISDYGFSFLSTGFIMCALALLTWFATMISEYGKLFHFALGLSEVPKGHTVFHLEEDQIALVKLSRKRLSFILSTVLARAAVQSILLWYGTLYLVYTETVQDLLLNAVALKFVLEVAELLYSAFAPRRTRTFIQSLKPLNLERLGASHHDCLLPTFFLALLCGMLALSYVFLLTPALEARSKTWEGLCGGRQDFAVATDGLGRLHYSLTSEYDDTGETELTSYVHRATDLLIKDAPPDDEQPWSIYVSTFDSLRKKVDSQSVVEAGGTRLCEDGDNQKGVDEWTHMGLQILKMVTRNDSLTDCASVVPYCTEVGIAGLRSRQWCPLSCGCADPLGGLLLDRVTNGCPAACAQKLASLAESIECKDGELKETMQYALGAKALFTQKGFQSKALELLADRMLDQGCFAVAYGGTAGMDFCVGSSTLRVNTVSFRTVKMVCPVACGCDGSGLPGHKRDMATVGAVGSGLRITGVCEEQGWLNETRFAPHGAAGSGAPVFLNEEGQMYLYHGPQCAAGTIGSRWILSPTLCNAGYYMAYTVNHDSSRPPDTATWFMDCRGSGWQEMTLKLSPLVEEKIPGNVWSRVNSSLQITSSLCGERKALVNTVFDLQGETDSGAPLYRASDGSYLYHGPHCGLGQSGKKWIISPALCTQGFDYAYILSEDEYGPPLSSSQWSVNCGRKGWLTMPIKFSPITLYGRIKTPKGFCLEPWHGDPLLQPCTADGSQLWIYNATSGLLKDRHGECLEAPIVGAFPSQPVGTPVRTTACDPDSASQKWTYDKETQQVKLQAGNCLDAAQPDTVGGRTQLFPCHIGNDNQIWVFSKD